MPAYTLPAGYCPNYTNASTTYYTPTWTSNSSITPTWINWNQNYTTTTQNYTLTYSNSFQDQVWHEWIVNTGNPGPYRPRILTPEETAAHDRRLREEREHRQAACTRARVLLGEFLDDEQKAELERHGRFHVTGSKGRRYCIRTNGGQSGNVDLLDDKGGVQARLCAHPRNYLPDGDAWLMQMIEIRHDEDHFLRTANVHQGRLPVAA